MDTLTKKLLSAAYKAFVDGKEPYSTELIREAFLHADYPVAKAYQYALAALERGDKAKAMYWSKLAVAYSDDIYDIYLKGKVMDEGIIENVDTAVKERIQEELGLSANKIRDLRVLDKGNNEVSVFIEARGYDTLKDLVSELKDKKELENGWFDITSKMLTLDDPVLTAHGFPKKYWDSVLELRDVLNKNKILIDDDSVYLDLYYTGTGAVLTVKKQDNKANTFYPEEILTMNLPIGFKLDPVMVSKTKKEAEKNNEKE